MSEEQEPDREDAAGDASPEDIEPEQDELDELDELGDDDGDDGDDGFDQAVAEARARAGAPPDPGELDPDDEDHRPYTREETGLQTRVGWGRSPIVSAAVIIVGLFLLAATWSDFRYFLRSVQSEPRDVGTVGDIYVDGAFSERFDNEWIVLEGDPDVQHAARMQGRDGWIGFMRLIESDASLFVAIPRATQNANNEFPGRFEGRMRRIHEVPQWDKLRTFFNAEEIVDIVDIEPSSLMAALTSGASQVSLVEGGETELAADDTLRVVVAQSTAMVQLGRTTWPTREAADAVIAVLDRPWAFVEKRDTVWVYAVELGEPGAKAGQEPDLELYQQLTRALNGDEDLASADPKVGGLVLPRRTTYLVEFGDLRAEGAELSFTYGKNTAETGWKVDASGERLEPVALQAGRLTVPAAALSAIRAEHALAANPDGYLLMVDQKPRDVWPSALMFGAVFGVVLLNGWALVATLRRRRAEATA